MNNYSREYIIGYGKDKGQTAGTIDRNLRKFGHDGLKLSEFNEISPIGNFLKDSWKNLLEFGQGAAAVPGMVVQKGLAGTLGDMITGLPDAFLSTYNLSTDKIAKGKISPWDIAQGIKERPLSAAADFTSAAGLLKLGKCLPQAAATSRVAKWMDELSPTTNAIRKAIAPTKNEKLLNRTLAHADVGAELKVKHIRDAVDEFAIKLGSKGVDRNQVLANLQIGSKLGNAATMEATKAGVKLGRLIETEAGKIGALAPEEMALNRQAQHVVYNNPVGDITHGEALDFINKINKGDKRTINAIPDYVKKLVGEAKLADTSSDLVYVPQILEHNKGLSQGLGEGVLNLLGKDRMRDYFSNVREIGNAAPEKLAKNMVNEFDFVTQQLKNAYSAENALGYLNKAMTQEATYDKALALSKNANRSEVVVPKKYFAEGFRKDMLRKSGKQIAEELMNDRASLGKIIRNPELAKDFVIVNKNDLKALGRSVTSVVPSGTLGKLVAIFKTGVLGRPKWFVENRTDNWTNLILSGVNVLKTIPLVIKYWDKFPDELDMTTSYRSLTGLESSNIGVGSGVKLAGQKIMAGLRNKAPLEVLKEVNSATGMPIYRAEAFCERFERANALMQQILNYSKKNKVSVDDVIKTLETDKELFWEFYKNVDDVLGDYTGRNYYMPNNIYKAVNLAMPFWKYPTQSLRLWGKQAYNHPLLYQGLVSTPAEMGRQYNEELMKKYGMDPETFTGGLLHRAPYGDLPMQTIQVPGTKFAAVPEMISQIFSPGYNKLPLFPIADAVNAFVNFKNPFGKTPTMKGVFEYNGKLYKDLGRGKFEEYKPTFGDRLKLMARGLLDNNVHAAGFIRYATRPGADALHNLIMRKDKPHIYYPQYDTTILPWGGVNTNATPKINPLDIGGRNIGVRVVDQYKPFKMTPSQLRKIQRNIQRKNIKRNKKIERDIKR